MNVPMSKRLLNTAMMVPAGATVADIGCDHGYLGIYLLSENIARHVIASDLRAKPLEAAIRNANRYRVADKMSFVCASGLRGILPEQADTIVCAGMGGDLITSILEETAWIFDERYTLLLQPQAGVPDLRVWLCRHGFSILKESACREDHFAYATMLVRFTGTASELTPGESFVSPAMRLEINDDNLYYIDRMILSAKKILDGLCLSKTEQEKIPYYRSVLADLKELRSLYEKSIGNSCGAG